MIQKHKTEIEKKIESLQVERRLLILEQKRIKKLENNLHDIEEKALPDELLELAMKFPMITSRRELEVLYCISKYLTIRQTAQALYVTEKTVRFHRTNIYKRTKLKSEKEVLRAINKND